MCEIIEPVCVMMGQLISQDGKGGALPPSVWEIELQGISSSFQHKINWVYKDSYTGNQKSLRHVHARNLARLIYQPQINIFTFGSMVTH